MTKFLLAGVATIVIGLSGAALAGEAVRTVLTDASTLAENQILLAKKEGKKKGKGHTVTCPAGQMMCGKACTNVATDVRNCGQCGVVCPAGSSCITGACF